MAWTPSVRSSFPNINHFVWTPSWIVLLDSWLTIVPHQRLGDRRCWLEWRRSMLEKRIGSSFCPYLERCWTCGMFLVAHRRERRVPVERSKSRTGEVRRWTRMRQSYFESRFWIHGGQFGVIATFFHVSIWTAFLKPVSILGWIGRYLGWLTGMPRSAMSIFLRHCTTRQCRNRLLLVNESCFSVQIFFLADSMLTLASICKYRCYRNHRSLPPRRCH